ncbi:transcription factor bHLH110-like [Papaver somniferum]|uniref:transcription factor bHLH110-like n=1 Tax=Papaver somniferum TaxID=3469 RepID=UPI000E7028CB|nr:transcription factor bHLH110-like [Papaver somniferum]
MEQYSGNLHHHHHHHHHHHQLQEQLNIVGSSSSSTSSLSTPPPPPPFYQLLGINNSSSTWNQNLILNNGGNYFNQNGNVNGITGSPRDEVISRQSKNNNDDDIHHFVPPSLNTSTIHHQNQDLSNFHGRGFIDVNDQSLHELHLAKIKKELLLSSSSSLDSHHASKLFSNEAIMNNTFSKNYFKNENQLQDFYEEDLSSTNTHLGDLYNNNPETFTGFGNSFNPLSRVHGNNFSQMMILPSTTISNADSNPQSFTSATTNTSPLGLSSFQALDLLSSSSTKNIGGGFDPDQTNSLFKDRSLSLNLYNNDMNPGVINNNWPSTNNPSKVNSLINGVTDAAKRPRPPGSSGNPKKTPQTTPVKKPRTESRSSIPPLKVRKEKLGDRIANLQQLVAPFGKTDTASVLMEAIGYIKFLQEQVETLSVPYMKSGRNNNAMRPKFQQGTSNARGGEVDTNEPKRDLRSRGLCLVPLSCTSYIITDDNSLSHVNWSTSGLPHFGGGSI